MYKKVLVPVALDHSRSFKAALDVARFLSDDGAVVTVLNVIDKMANNVDEYLPESHSKVRISEVETELKAELGGVLEAKPVVIRRARGQRYCRLRGEARVRLHRDRFTSTGIDGLLPRIDSSSRGPACSLFCPCYPLIQRTRYTQRPLNRHRMLSFVFLSWVNTSLLSVCPTNVLRSAPF